MRSSPISTEAGRRSRRRLTAVAAAGLVGLLLGACSEVQVEHPTPVPPTPSGLPTLPPIGFNHRYGNNPVASADAFTLERQLFAQKEYWEVAIAASPVAAGYVPITDAAATVAARPHLTSVTLVLATESLVTIRALLAGGDPAQQAYCVKLLDGLRATGYSGLTAATVDVYFGEQDRHAELTWNPTAGYRFTVFDNDLRGTQINPNPSGTPFPTVPTATP